MKLNISTGKE